MLYHCVLALGCQHDGGGSFEPAAGLAWRLFSTALAQYPDLLMMPDSLTTVQALAAMAIYTSGISCLSIEHPVISEAARRVQRVVRTNLTGHQADLAYRTFWVLYSMEKVSSFYMGRTSVRIYKSPLLTFMPDELTVATLSSSLSTTTSRAPSRPSPTPSSATSTGSSPTPGTRASSRAP